jgi:type I restriction enzyme S subunit
VIFDITIPPDWQRASVSKYCHVQLGKMLQPDPSGDEDELLPYLRAISISKNGIDLSHQFAMWIKPHEKRKFRLKRDDVLVSEGGDAGRTAYFDSAGEYYFQNAINRIRPLDVNLITSRYLFYWFTFLKLAGYVDLVCNVATIAHFTAEKVKSAPIAFPSLGTQRLIVAFLDEKTAQIDTLIAKKQALLDRLAEKRRAIITQAVTKGLNPSAPMKESGLDWVGPIPAHWELRRLKFLVRDGIGLQMGPFGGMLTDLSPEPTGFKLYGQENTISGNFELGRRWIEEERFHDLARYQLHAGDLVITRKGSLGSCRRFPTDALPGLADSDTIIVRFDEEKLQSALAITLLHDAAYVAAQIESTRRGAILAGLNSSVVGDLWLVCPTGDEQSAITKWCERFKAKIDELIAAIEKSITDINGYRSALITAAVTGQIEGLQ